MKYVRLHVKWISAFGGVRLGLSCIKQKNNTMKLLIYLIFQRWQAVCFTGNSHGCFLQFACFTSAQVTREVSSTVQDLPSRIFQERDTTTEGSKNILTKLWHLPESIWQSPPCASQGSLYREFCFHVDALDSWSTMYFKLIIHVSLQSKLSTAF